MIGEATLVPPISTHCPPYTIATPVLGSASAATSATVRAGQPLSSCHDGFGMYWLQPLPAPDGCGPLQVPVPQTVSDHDRPRFGFPSLVSVVPPTAVTYCEAAGKETP